MLEVSYYETLVTLYNEHKGSCTLQYANPTFCVGMLIGPKTLTAPVMWLSTNHISGTLHIAILNLF